MRVYLSLICSFLLFQSFAQSRYQSVVDFQNEINTQYASKEESPLTESDLAHFTALPFFPIDTTYSVIAKFKRHKKPKGIILKTTTSREAKYDIYGELHFKLKGKKCKLFVYQSHRLRGNEEFKDYLFLPFTDLSNGHQSYGGGRFIDLEIPEGKTMVVDFNKAYNPYCAYNHKYSCPIPPKENFLDLLIEAGVKAPETH